MGSFETLPELVQLYDYEANLTEPSLLHVALIWAFLPGAP